MKKFLFILSLIFLFPVYQVQAQMYVDQKYTKLQIEREVFVRWGRKKNYLLVFRVRDKFQPYWYYIATHNKYMMGHDKRNILQLAPTLAFTEVTKDSAEAEQEDVEVQFKNYLAKEADRELNKRWELFEKDKFQKLYGEIDAALLTTDSFYKISERTKTDFKQTYLSIKDKVNIIRDSYMDDAKKGEAFLTYYDELRKFHSKILSFNKAVLLMEKYDYANQVEPPFKD